jgi:hypothetical protein
MIESISRTSNGAYSINGDVLLGQRLLASLAVAQLSGALGTLAAAVQRH